MILCGRGFFLPPGLCQDWLFMMGSAEEITVSIQHYSEIICIHDPLSTDFTPEVVNIYALRPF